tara:strand:- start:1055 stop:1420 length:366 start_codon:yes stop_codon:yes gene_type:complete
MTFNYPNSNALLASINDQQLYHNLVAQLRKDFNLANIEFGFLEDNDTLAPQELIAALREKMYFLLMERFTEYLNLLYIVDLPERALKEIQVTDAVEVAEQVAFLVLQREWQKVWYKNEYSR